MSVGVRRNQPETKLPAIRKAHLSLSAVATGRAAAVRVSTAAKSLTLAFSTFKQCRGSIGHLQLLRCYYNFLRPHWALKFGHLVRTPAMQAGLSRQRLTFREIFSPTIIFWARGKFVLVFAPSTISVAASNKGMSLAA